MKKKREKKKRKENGISGNIYILYHTQKIRGVMTRSNSPIYKFLSV